MFTLLHPLDIRFEWPEDKYKKILGDGRVVDHCRPGRFNPLLLSLVAVSVKRIYDDVVGSETICLIPENYELIGVRVSFWVRLKRLCLDILCREGVVAQSLQCVGMNCIVQGAFLES